MEGIFSFKKMKQIDKKFERLNNLLIAITEKSSYTKKKYTKQLLEELYQEIINLEKRIEQLTDIKPDIYHDQLLKAIRLLQLFGISQVSFTKLEKEFVEWLVERQSAVNKNFTLEQITNFSRLYDLYKLNYGKTPDKLIDFKQLIKEFELNGY